MKFSDLNALKLILKIKKISINKIIHSSTAAGGVVYLGTSTGEIIEIVSDRLIIKKIHDDSITDIKVFRCADLNGEECVDALRGRNKIDLKNRKKKEIHFYATASQDSTIKIWENGNLIQTLKGHLDRVNEILWIDDFKDNNCNPSLISVSNDNTVIIWAYTFGKWSINQRLGGIMEKNKAFLGVYNERDCLWVLGLTGFYKYVVDSKSMKYKLVEGISGHQSPVMDLDWKNGVLMSCGKDMTVRLFERRYFNNNVKKDFKKDHDNFKDDHKEGINFKDFKKGCDNSEDFKKGCDNSEDFKKGCDDFKDENEEINFTGDYDSANEIAEENQFHEISRPVIHGYPVFSSKFFMDGIVIGSDEPVLRIFKPSEYFLKLNCHSAITRNEGINISSIDSKKNNTNFNSSPSDRPIEYVTNSELSLTNEIHCDILDEPLNEKSLSDFLLFKETKKLYGHYFSVRSVVVKNNLVFSVNKSRCRSYSQIYVWKSSIFADRKGNGEKKRDEGNNNNHCADDFNDADIKLIQKVGIHDLEITRLRIKKNFLVACSRDRTFSIYRINSDYKKSSINSDYKKSTNNSDSDYKKSTNNSDSDYKKSTNNSDSENCLEFLHRFYVHKKAVNDAILSPDLKYIASVADDRKLIISEVNLDKDNLKLTGFDSDKEELKNNLTNLAITFEDELTAVDWNKFLFVGDSRGFIYVFDENFREIFRNKIHNAKINCIRVDGDLVATGGDDFLLRIFEIQKN